MAEFSLGAGKQPGKMSTYDVCTERYEVDDHNEREQRDTAIP